jgi:hypothetical protein
MGITLEYKAPQTKRASSYPFTELQAVAMAGYGVILPAACFALSATGTPWGPEWQDGSRSAYLGLMLSGKCGWPFVPLLLFSMASLMGVLWDPERAARTGWQRLGVCTGVAMAVQFVAMQAAVMSTWRSLIVQCLAVFAAVVVGVPAIALSLEVLTASRAAAKGWARVMAWLLVVGATAPVVPALFAAPALAAWAYLSACRWMWDVRCDDARRAREAGAPVPARRRDAWGLLAALVAWPAAYVLAWRTAYGQAVAVYQALPTANPDCYIATAAARGHGWVVRSRPVATPCGDFRCNRQLRVLKCAEVAVKVAWPGGHRLVRAAYDRIGPVLVRRMKWRWTADLAYLLLKPAEWSGDLLLRRLVPAYDPERLWSEAPTREGTVRSSESVS